MIYLNEKDNPYYSNSCNYVVCLGLIDSRLTLFKRGRHSNKSIIKADMHVEVMRV